MMPYLEKIRNDWSKWDAFLIRMTNKTIDTVIAPISRESQEHLRQYHKTQLQLGVNTIAAAVLMQLTVGNPYVPPALGVGSAVVLLAGASTPCIGYLKNHANELRVLSQVQKIIAIAFPILFMCFLAGTDIPPLWHATIVIIGTLFVHSVLVHQAKCKHDEEDQTKLILEEDKKVVEARIMALTEKRARIFTIIHENEELHKIWLSCLQASGNPFISEEPSLGLDEKEYRDSKLNRLQNNVRLLAEYIYYRKELKDCFIKYAELSHNSNEKQLLLELLNS